MSETLQHDRLAALAHALKLERMATEWPAVAQDVIRADGTMADFLERLLLAETEARAERQRSTLMKLATLPVVKTLEQFDFGFASGVPKAQVTELATSPSSSVPRTSSSSVRPAWARAISPWPSLTER
jgi:DNA replication protein DnaC